MRFVAREGELVEGRDRPTAAGAGRPVPGRGTYTCRELACFTRAVERRGFARSLRTAVHVNPGLARLYTGEVDGERR